MLIDKFVSQKAYPSLYGHCVRVSNISVDIGKYLELSSTELEDLYNASLLHDIGKTLTPEYVREKRTRYTPSEWDVIKEHPRNGVTMAMDTVSQKSLEGILFHHEAYSGCGYPAGLNGDNIPLIAKIISVADVFDSLRTDFPYRKGQSYRNILFYLEVESSRSLDPDIVNVFKRIFFEKLRSSLPEIKNNNIVAEFKDEFFQKYKLNLWEKGG